MRIVSTFLKAPATDRIIRFILVGSVAFLLDAGLVFAMTNIGFSLYLSRALSLIVVVLFTFMLNRRATFNKSGLPEAREVVAYVGASLVGLGINYAIFTIAIFCHFPWIIAMAVSTLIASTFNFLVYGRIFKTESNTDR